MELFNYNELALPFIFLIIVMSLGVIGMFQSNKNKLTLVNLGKNFYRNGVWYDLSDYYVDRKGNLYSRNAGTWEVDPKKDKDILICSNNSTDKCGNIVNSLRSSKGRKVTIKRSQISYTKLIKRGKSVVTIDVEKVGKRHLKITKVGA